MRQTSIDCYNQIVAEGLLSKRRMEVYTALYKLSKPSTAREIYATMNVDKQEATRLTELRNLGAVYESGVRKCTVTGRSAIEWDLTDNLPIGKEIKTKIIPKNFKRVIDFIQIFMDENGLMWIDKQELQKIKSLDKIT